MYRWVSTVFYRIFVEVRDPFVIAPVAVNEPNLMVSGNSVSIQSNDSTVADVQIRGYGVFNTPLSGVNFILPSNLPSGLNFVTSNGDDLVLRVQQPSESNTVGGLQLYSGAPAATTVTIQAYQPTSFYDTPARAYNLTLTVGSLAQSQGTLDFGLGAQYNSASNYLEVDADVAVLNGVLQNGGAAVSLPLQYI